VQQHSAVGVEHGPAGEHRPDPAWERVEEQSVRGSVDPVVDGGPSVRAPRTWSRTRTGGSGSVVSGCASCCVSTGCRFSGPGHGRSPATGDKDAKLDRIEEVTSKFPNRCFAFDQFGPLSIRPCHGSTWAPESGPMRLPATYHRTHGIRYFHGCYSLSDDQLRGVNRRRKGGDHTLAALKSIRAARPDGAPI
jgi:hypothetical protein